MTRVSLFTLLIAAALPAVPALAQAPAGIQPYVGLSGGYHDLGSNPIGDDDGAIGGVYAGVDVPVSGNFVIGVEGNFHLGTNAIDSEYGGAARLGYRFANGGLAYVRGGYQEVNFDLGNLTGIPVPPGGFDDTDGDYLVGIGGEFPLGASGRTKLRVGVDTIAFDTVRPTVGISFGF